MHKPPALAQGIAAAHGAAVPLRGVCYRAGHLHHFSNFLNATPLFTANAGPAGSRYVPPNGPPALYLGLAAETAYQEFNQGFLRARASVAGRALEAAGQLRPAPCVTLGVYVSVSRLLDLRRGSKVRALLGIRTRSDAELLKPWAGVPNAPTQVLGTDVYNDGFFEGLLYPSAQHLGQVCVVLFPQRLLPTSLIDFRDAVTNIAARLP